MQTHIRGEYKRSAAVRANRGLFKGRHFDREIVIRCELVHQLQIELAGSGDRDGGTEDFGDPDYDPAWVQR